tara:strand:- start:359 stop:649 length:291 start_codon:yes stop_codon:yes gene_type:complete
VWFNILKNERRFTREDREMDEEAVMEEMMRQWKETRLGPQLDPNDPLSKDIIDTREKLSDIEDKMVKLRNESIKLNEELRVKLSELKNLKERQEEE